MSDTASVHMIDLDAYNAARQPMLLRTLEMLSSSCLRAAVDWEMVVLLSRAYTVCVYGSYLGVKGRLIVEAYCLQAKTIILLKVLSNRDH